MLQLKQAQFTPRRTTGAQRKKQGTCTPLCPPASVNCTSRLGATIGCCLDAAVGVDNELPGKLGEAKREGRGGIELLEAKLGAGDPSRKGNEEVLALAGGKRELSGDLLDAMMIEKHSNGGQNGPTSSGDGRKEQQNVRTGERR